MSMLVVRVIGDDADDVNIIIDSSSFLPSEMST